jgi:poly(hydroxyalkanoate) depolymerase family esterase
MRPTPHPSLWSRFKSAVGRYLRREPAPGRWKTDAKTALTGFLSLLPWRWPRREYLLYVPRGFTRWRRAPLYVYCHGCHQTPEELAQGTRVAAVADALGCLVLMPRQMPEANPYRCWNWFDDATMLGRGETAIVLAMIRSVRRWYRADPARVVVVGMSAGGALAAVLGLRGKGIVRAVVVHSGIACGAALSAFTAIGVMRRGPETNVEAIADAAREHGAPAVPLLAIHGESDHVVSARNAVALVRQYLRLHAHPASFEAHLPSAVLPKADAETHGIVNERSVNTREWRCDGALVVRYVTVAGLGHAWSGGDDAVPFHDPRGPDATALAAAFAQEALS